jgi:hypothetical protein
MQTAGMKARGAFFVSLCAIAAFPALGHSQVADPATQTASTGRDASIAEYRQHLQTLTTIVNACAKARDTKTCDPALVGPDDRVPLGEGAQAERRLIRYDWLRALLAMAQEKDQAAKPDAVAQAVPAFASARPPKRTTTELLQDAETRLAHDLAQVDRQAAPVAAHSQERDAMAKVLAGREFRNLEEPSARDTILEKIGNGINRFFERVARFSGRSPWIGLLVKWGFLGAVCVGLVWGLIQLERRWRIRLVPSQEGPAPGAASARDWQLWLEDARRAAAAGRLREAVHFVYWASISRLESRRLWPADRARTPREYLALVALEDPRKAGLATLTGSFERIWYGGRAAAEGDYRAAEQLASALIDIRGAVGGASGGAAGGSAG